MKYKEFITTVEQHQTDKVRALNIPESSSPDSIPRNFSSLIPDVLKIIDKHFSELSDGKSMIGIFGLQPIGYSLTSKASTNRNNNTASQSLLSHLCCVLYFLPINSLSAIKSWKNFKSLVIDFTQGIVIDQERYLHCVINSKGVGKSYGKINSKKLANVWQQNNCAI